MVQNAKEKKKVTEKLPHRSSDVQPVPGLIETNLPLSLIPSSLTRLVR